MFYNKIRKGFFNNNDNQQWNKLLRKILEAQPVKALGNLSHFKTKANLKSGTALNCGWEQMMTQPPRFISCCIQQL